MKRIVVIDNVSAYTAFQAESEITSDKLSQVVHRRRQLKSSRLMLLLTACFMAIYFADVVAGAYWKAAFLSNVAAVLALVLASVCFTFAIVELERREKANSAKNKLSDTLE
ncbi:hypothetical protein [Granulosicoccus antarcticus]|uniref:Uncharacterized protein n=1 Tax=Granulosicoccus antarcticus IMCC3135 TaxID=1192854 RepID=A0A2Z2NUW7_9GAMM|nr:hypothetical protein [Granulosicoccus antarcticus]ASJ75266.1 hypothetical protein IMCC3135_26055 [Granulosicoccus antarcticus IMCC3135]